MVAVILNGGFVGGKYPEILKGFTGSSKGRYVVP